VIVSKARFRFHRHLGRIVGYRLPDSAFHGAVIEALLSISYDSFDRTTREQIFAFHKAFLQCKCPNSPLCGCPERKFVKELIELRESGLDHRQISEFLADEYGIEMYPADILSFLEETVHVLEAVRDVASQVDEGSLRRKTEQHIEAIEKGVPVGM
jgi:superfamily II helicase